MWDKAGGGLSAGACFIPVVDLSPSWPWRAENSASLPAGVCARWPCRPHPSLAEMGRAAVDGGPLLLGGPLPLAGPAPEV